MFTISPRLTGPPPISAAAPIADLATRFLLSYRLPPSAEFTGFADRFGDNHFQYGSSNRFLMKSLVRKRLGTSKINNPRTGGRACL